MRTTRRFASLTLSLAIGCAGSGQPSPDPRSADASASAGATRYNSLVITQAELDESSIGDVDALTLIKQLRPHFLTYRGLASTSDPSAGNVQVSVNNGGLSGIEVLSSMRKSEIGEIRYLSAASAAQRFGSQSKAGPVILLRRR